MCFGIQRFRNPLPFREEESSYTIFYLSTSLHPFSRNFKFSEGGPCTPVIVILILLHRPRMKCMYPTTPVVGQKAWGLCTSKASGVLINFPLTPQSYAKSMVTHIVQRSVVALCVSDTAVIWVKS